MNKMERPMMTVVRFGAEDVIATSSPVANSHYVALGSEIDQSLGYNAVFDKSALYQIYYNGGNNFGIGGETDNNSTDPYAWYNSTNGWTTDYKTAASYSELPVE